MQTAENTLYYIDPDKLEIYNRYEETPELIWVENLGATIQVYAPDKEVFNTVGQGAYRSFRLVTNSILVGEENMRDLTENDVAMHIYAKVRVDMLEEDGQQTTIVPSTASLIFSISSPDTYTFDGIPEYDDENNEVSRTHYIHIGTLTYDHETDRIIADYDTGILGTDRYIEMMAQQAAAAEQLFTEEVDDNRHRIRQRYPLVTNVVYKNSFPQDRVPSEENQSLVLNPEEDGAAMLLLDFMPGTRIALPQSTQNIGLEYTLVGVSPSYGMSSQSTVYPFSFMCKYYLDGIATIMDNIMYFDDGQVKHDIHPFYPAYPCLIKLLATPQGWLVTQGAEYLRTEIPSGESVVSGTWYVGQITKTRTQFASLTAEQLLSASDPVSLMRKTAGLTINKSCWFVMVPQGVRVTDARYTTSGVTSMFSEQEIENGFGSNVTHSDITIDGTTYKVYVNRNTALVDSGAQAAFTIDY